MIIQALTRFYDIKANDPACDISRYGYSRVDVSFVATLSEDGEMINLEPLFQTVKSGKKTIDVPTSMIVPEQASRSGTKPPPYLLCDNAMYIFGIVDPKKIEKDPTVGKTRFESFRNENISFLETIDDAEANALRLFLSKYDFAAISENELVTQFSKELEKMVRELSFD